MIYKNNKDLPDAVQKHLPKHAQDIYREAFNHAHVEYSDKSKRNDPKEPLEEICHKVAWSAVKHKYYKGEEGNWHKVND